VREHQQRQPYTPKFKGTLPLLQPYIAIALIFRLAQAFGVFDRIQVMTGGGPASSTESLSLYAYLNAMRFLDFGYSATLVVASFVLLTLVCATVWIIAGQWQQINQKFGRS
jgi:multiple sugar transport system permease protein